MHRKLNEMQSLSQLKQGNISVIVNQLDEEQSRAANMERSGREIPEAALNKIDRLQSQVRDIEREIATPELAKRLDVRHPNRNTVRRVMEFIGRFGKDLLEFAPSSSDERRNERNLVIIDRYTWTEYTQQFQDTRDVTAGAASTNEGGGGQQVLTDGGDVTLS
jgi:hypothetical protein